MWITLTCILGIAFWIGVALLVWGKKSSDESFGQKLPGGALAGIAALAWIALTLALSIHTLGTGQAALVYDFSGKLSGKVTAPGVFTTAPWQHVTKTDVFLQTEDWILDANNSAVSKDQQSIFADIALNYEIDPAGVEELYRTVGPGWKRKLIDSRVLQDFKEVTATYSAQEITTKREQLRTATRDRLIQEFKKYPGISVSDFFVRNLSYSKDYEDSISAKNVQVQKALEARAKVQESKAEASQQVAAAAGDARSTLLRAKADAKALSLKGAAIRRNPDVLRLEAIDKLNPNAEVIICTGTGSGNCPSFLPTAAPATSDGKG